MTSAIAAGEKDWLAMAVATPGGHSPCGACRQVLWSLRRTCRFSWSIPIIRTESSKPT